MILGESIILSMSACIQKGICYESLLIVITLFIHLDLDTDLRKASQTFSNFIEKDEKKSKTYHHFVIKFKTSHND